MCIDYITKLKDNVILEVTQKKEKTARTRQQDKYWFWVVCPIIWDFMGESIIATHLFLKSAFKIESITELEKDEFAFMITSIKEMFKEHWVNIPSPWEDEFLLFYNNYVWYN